MEAAAVFHDEYFGTVNVDKREIADDATAEQIWTLFTGIDDRPPQEMQDAYIEDWNAYGSHHKGMITRIWWGEGSHDAAQTLYDELIDQDVQPA